MSTTASQVLPHLVYAHCFVCGQYGLIFHQYVLPRSGRVLVCYCSSCFGVG